MPEGCRGIGLGGVWGRDGGGENVSREGHSLGIWEWLWFSCGVAECRQSSISVLKSFLLVLTKFSFWKENWALGY